MPMSRMTRDVVDEEYVFEIPTSMIDVTFLLLIFFMLSATFRTVEKKVDANLPTDEGPTDASSPPPPVFDTRVRIFWSNAQGQVIHSPSRALLETLPQAPVSLTGAHVRIQAGRTDVRDMNELARLLAEMSARNPDTPVIIDARLKVPFRYVLGAVDACARANIEKVKFQAPAVEGGGGDDWWWM